MKNLINKIQQIVPMNVGSLMLLIVIIYMMTIVGKTIWDNYQSNRGISEQEEEVIKMQSEVAYMEDEIVYYGSQSFKEKQARAKLGYILPGETVISVPKDKKIEVESHSTLAPDSIKSESVKPNYIYWKEYFFN